MQTNFLGFLNHRLIREKNNMKMKIMAENKNEKIPENTDKPTERQEKNRERNAGFLPIFFWTD
jgi:hypothetical protein